MSPVAAHRAPDPGRARPGRVSPARINPGRPSPARGRVGAVAGGGVVAVVAGVTVAMPVEAAAVAAALAAERGAAMPERPDAVLEPAQVLTYLQGGDVRLLHVTNDADEYAREHVAGAVHAEGYGDFTEERGGVRALVPTRERMAETLGRLGVSPEQRVICYAAGRSPWPARAYWVLRYFGFARVHVVNGDLLPVRPPQREAVFELVTLGVIRVGRVRHSRGPHRLTTGE